MYLGIDTHKRCSQVAVVDADGNLQDETRLSNDRLDDPVEKYASSEAAIEASSNYRPIYEMLDQYLDVTLINQSKNRIIAGTTVKTDRVDSKRFVHILQADILAESTFFGTRSTFFGTSSVQTNRPPKGRLLKTT